MQLNPTLTRLSNSLYRKPHSHKTRITLRFVMVSLAAILVLPIGTGIVQPAAAAKSDCANGRLCLWFDLNYTGLRTDYYAPISPGCHNLSATFNDKVTSVYNHTDYSLQFYLSANCPFGSDPSDFFSYGASSGYVAHNDRYSSFYYY